MSSACGGPIKSIVVPSSLRFSLMGVEELTISSNEYSDASVSEFKLSGLSGLKRIIVNRMNFTWTKTISLTGKTL